MGLLIPVVKVVNVLVNVNDLNVAFLGTLTFSTLTFI